MHYLFVSVFYKKKQSGNHLFVYLFELIVISCNYTNHVYLYKILIKQTQMYYLFVSLKINFGKILKKIHIHRYVLATQYRYRYRYR